MTAFPDRMGSDGISGGEMTPGPWTLGEWDRNIFVYGGPNNDDIAEFNFADEHTVKITREEAIANARLFLGARELLSAADGIGKWLSAALDDPNVCGEMKADINEWFAALTKAVEGSNERDVLRGAAPSGSEQECDSRSPKSTAPRARSMDQVKGRTP